MPIQRCNSSKCFSAVFLFAGLGLGLNFLFLLRLEGKSPKLSVFSSLPERKLAVVVPAHHGDLDKALASLALWPRTCSPVTLANMDLVIYYAEVPDEKSDKILPTLTRTGGQCFARTSVVFGNLTEEVRVGDPCVQVYASRLWKRTLPSRRSC